MPRIAILAGLIALFVAACGSTRPQTEDERSALTKDVEATKARFEENDPGLKGWFRDAHGYAVFPSVGKGGMGVGGAYGRGQVYEKGRLVGYTTLTQATIGLQLGGQAYSEVIFFRDQAALDRFTGGNFELGAQASAVAATAGASTDADYSGGVAVFTMARGGLMYEASVGGQKFEFEPEE
jgi:lipid-binding SYLF domain-containing protein